MRYKQILIILFALFALSKAERIKAQTDTTNRRGLSFDMALQISMENNYGLAEANKYAQMKEQEMKSTRGLYLPKISLSASWMVLSEDIHLDLNPVKDAITPLYGALGNYGNFSGVPNPDPSTNTVYPTLPDNVSTAAVREKLRTGLEEIEAANWDKTIQKNSFGFVSAGFSYPLYAGGKIRSANKAASIYYDEALNELEIKRSQMISELVERYFGLVLAQEALTVREDVLKTMSLHLQDAQRLMEEGMIANAEYLHAKVYYSETEREMKKAKRQIGIAHQALLNSMSMKSDAAILPVSGLFYLDSIQPLSYFLESAAANSQLLEKVNFKKDLASTKYNVEKGNFLPSIAAMGTYDLMNKDLSPYMPDYAVGVGLKWDIFDGGSRLRNLQAAKLQQEQVDNIYDKASSDISMAITKYYHEMKMQMEQLEDLKTAYVFANEYYRVRNKAFTEGISTASEVADASLALAKVKIEMLQAMYQFDLALSKTLYYSGRASDFELYRLTTAARTSFNDVKN